MSTPIPCTTCATVLVPHCKPTTGTEVHPTCQWMRCPNRECTWIAYDLTHGRRFNHLGQLEQFDTET